MPGSSSVATRAHSRWDRPLGAIAIAIAAVATLAIGGVHPLTQVLLALATLALTAAYLLPRGRTGARVVPFASLLALAAAATALQLVPLPASLVHLLSPAGYEVRRSASASGWLPLTLDVPATLLALVRALTALGLLVVVAGAARSRRAARRLLLGIALVGGGFALIAFAQKLAGSSAILGFYRPRSTPGSGVFGTFVDINHAAALLALTTLVGAGLGFELPDRRRFVAFGCAGLSAVALLMTMSRGGLVGFAAGGLVLTAVLLARSLGVARGLVSAVVLLLVAASVTLWAGEGLRARFMPPSANELWKNQKTRGWRDGLTMASDYAWTGVGRGAFEAPLRAYRGDDEWVRLVYPENFIVEYAAEWGLPVTLALMLLALVGVKRTLAEWSELTPGTIGAAAGVISIVVHELFDFATEMPGVALPAIVALGVVAGRVAAQEDRPPRLRPAVTWPLMALAAAAIALGLWAAPRTLDGDDARLHDAFVAKVPALSGELATAIARHPADDYLEQLAAEDGLRRRDAAGAMHHLNRALLLHPANAQTHQIVARLLAKAGRPAQAALEYRLALQHGLAPDYKELTAVLGRFVVDAVPQEPTRLTALAGNMIGIGRVPDAVAACRRADELAQAAQLREPTLVACTKLALDYNVPALLLPSAEALAEEANEPESFVLAARALAQAGRANDAAALMNRAIKRHATDGSLVLVAARLHFESGDLAGARALIGGRGDSTFSLAEQAQANLLLAEIADKAGDPEAAIVARARARMVERRMQESSFNQPEGQRK
ncbi:MAG TPA: O-antigen ligase family protein [Polyangia bacterium]|nr:O-antigen ligase family protein [Polyangia bacterium]